MKLFFPLPRLKIVFVVLLYALCFCPGSLLSAGSGGPGLRAILGAGTPLGFTGLETLYDWRRLELSAGIGKGWTGAQYAAMLKVFPGKDRVLYLGAGPSYGIHEGKAVSQLSDPVTGKKYTDIRVDFKDRYYWLNAEAGLTGSFRKSGRAGFFYSLALGGAYLYDTDYRTLSASDGTQTIAGLILQPISDLDLSLKRPTFKRRSLYPYFSAGIGYKF